MYQGGTANAHYRAVVPMQEMERRGHAVLWPVDPSLAMDLREIPACDLVHIHRFVMEKDLVLVRRLRAGGIAVTWDTDDDISAIPRGGREYRRVGGRRRIREHFARSLEIARTASVMTTPSPQLAALYRGNGVRHVKVIENYLAPAAIRTERHRHQGVVIGVVAGAEHERDLERLRIGRTLRAVLADHPHVRVVSIGVDLAIRHARYVNHRIVPIDELPAHLVDVDIGIAPLLDGRLNAARSNVKLKEFAAAGAMWLASPRGPYADMGEHQGGRLVEDDAWRATLDHLVQDHRTRVELARRARAWVQEQSIRSAGGRWEATFRSAILNARRGSP